jgi:hypothetical protein
MCLFENAYGRRRTTCDGAYDSVVERLKIPQMDTAQIRLRDGRQIYYVTGLVPFEANILFEVLHVHLC